MENETYIGSDFEKFKKVLDEHTNEDIEADRISKIIQDYSREYNIKGVVATVQGRQVHIDYLPTIDAMLGAIEEYECPLEVVGAALFKIEKDCCLFLTNSKDPNLKRMYVNHKEDADKVASELWRLVDREYEIQMTHVIATILSGSFELAFGQLYGTWRRLLADSTTDNISAGD